MNSTPCFCGIKDHSDLNLIKTFVSSKTCVDINMIHSEIISTIMESKFTGTELFDIAVIHYIIWSVSEICHKKCLFCLNPNKFNEFAFTIANNSQHLAVLFNSYYSLLPLPITQCIFRSFKIMVNSTDGMYSYDINQTMLNLIKSRRIKDLVYLGILYKFNENSEANQTVQTFIDCCINSFKNKKNIALIQATHIPQKPNHWCAIFGSFENKVLYWYNSLSKEEHYPSIFFSQFKSEFPDWKILVNNYRHQGDSSFCGIYAINFIFKMNENYSNWKLFNSDFINDVIVKNKIQHQYIYNKIENSSPFMHFLENFSK
jgi:hypothetical protein